MASNVSSVKEKAKDQVLRTQGRVLQAQEKVAERVSKTLDKVPFGEALKKNISSRSGQLNFFLFPFWEKSLICLVGKSVIVRETLFSSVTPSSSLVSVSDTDTAPFKGPQLAFCVASRIPKMEGHS